MSGGHAHHHHDHGHPHGHHHHHPAPAAGDWRWVIGVALNGGFVVVEAVAGVVGHSTALLADAGHNLSDVLSLAMAGAAAWLARRPSGPRRTYGFGKATVLAALANAVILVFACGFIAREAIGRLASRTNEPSSGLMIGVALAGVLVNGLTAALFAQGRKDDLNVRSAFVHMAADAAISAGVAVAGALIILTGRAWIDPATSLVILVIILFGSWEVLKEAFDLAIDTAPAAVDMAEVRNFLAACPGVSAVHDLHVWPLSTTETALTAHLVRADGGGDEFLKGVCRELNQRFNIGHATLQVELESLEACEELHA